MFDRDKNLMWSKLKVGLVITLASFILFITVFFAGTIENIFLPKVELKAQIKDVKGLRIGAPVWVSGIEVGSVKGIRLHPEYGTVVTLSIRKDALEYIEKDSLASVLTMGLLGDKFIELSPGTPQAGQAGPGDMLKGTAQIEFGDVMDTAVASISKMADFISKLESLVEKIEKGEGTLNKFLTDPSLYEELRKTTKSLSLTLEDMRSSRGSLGLLLKDPSLYNKMLSTTNSFEEFGKRLNESSGTIKKLTEDPELYDNLNRTSKQLSSILERIDKGEGIAGSLVSDSELSKELKDTIKELKDLTKDIKENPKKYFKFSVF